MTALSDIQKAIYTKLTSDATLMSMITGVFDYVPENQPFPYITLNDLIESPYNTFDRNGKNVLVTLQIWSDDKGYKRSFAILSRLNALLDNGTIPLTNHQLVSIQYESTLPRIDAFDGARQVPARYRVIVQEV